MIAACDCYVSLHRSEGFGLTVAEAMLLGKPVIATRYGGTLEFMNDDNAYLVDWEPTEVGEGAYPYPPRGRSGPSPTRPGRGADAPGARRARAGPRARGDRGRSEMLERHSPRSPGRRCGGGWR